MPAIGVTEQDVKDRVNWTDVLLWLPLMGAAERKRRRDKL